MLISTPYKQISHFKGPGFQQIAIPLLGTRMYGWNKKLAMKLAAQAMVSSLLLKLPISEVRFVLYQSITSPEQAFKNRELLQGILAFTAQNIDHQETARVKNKLCEEK